MTGEPLHQNPFTEAQIENLHIQGFRPLITPAESKRAHPASETSIQTVIAGRESCRPPKDPYDPANELVVVTGGCSVRTIEETLEYTHHLAEQQAMYKGYLKLVQRVYFEKPRTTLGWEGFITDPHLDESFDFNYGILAARKLLCKITEIGVPVGSELLDSITIDHYTGLLSWGAIGARTTESPLHKHLASGLSFTTGFKNGTSGDVQVAINGALGARHPHHFPGTDEDGRSGVITTSGNPDTHIILRGGAEGPNYEAESVADAANQLIKAGLSPAIMIDASHANSYKDYRMQIDVVRSVGAQIATGNTAITGIMIEADLKEGKQELIPGVKPEYGISITDGCVGLPENKQMFEILAGAVEAGRRAS